MVESTLHKTLVTIIERWMKTNSLEEMIVYVDSEKSFSGNMPPRIDTFIPDVFAKGRNSERMIIGEAKSSQRDLESEHSEKQLIAYLRHCKNKLNSVVVLAVPFDIYNCAKSLLEAIKKQNQLISIKTEVLSFISPE